MLHTSLRVIHQTDRFTVTKFEAAAGQSTAAVVVVEQLDNRNTVCIKSFAGDSATMFLDMWRATISQSVNTRPVAKPFAVDEFLLTFF